MVNSSRIHLFGRGKVRLRLFPWRTVCPGFRSCFHATKLFTLAQLYFLWRVRLPTSDASRRENHEIQGKAGYSPRWLRFWSQPRRQNLKLSEQTEHLQAGRPRLHAFLYSRGRRETHNTNEKSTLGSYCHPRRARFFWRVVPCRLSASHVYRRGFDSQLDSHHQEIEDARAAAYKEKSLKLAGDPSALQRKALQ